MCLSLAIQRPDDVLSRGTHVGFEWMTVHNRIGYRCGYVRLPAGHPWHGSGSDDLVSSVRVHGGITFAKPDESCGKGTDDAWWIGFDAAHGEDAPDPALPGGAILADIYADRDDHIWTQMEVEAECRSLCEQASRVVGGGMEPGTLE